MIDAVLSAEQRQRVSFVPLRDHLYSDNRWLAEVQQKVLDDSEEGDRILLVGHHGERSNPYLHLFPQWDLEELADGGDHRRHHPPGLFLRCRTRGVGAELMDRLCPPAAVVRLPAECLLRSRHRPSDR